MTFRWNNWNIEHIERHGVTPQDAAYVVAHAERPYPLRHVNGTWLVWGAAIGGRLLQVVYVIDENDSVFVVHARPPSRADTGAGNQDEYIEEEQPANGLDRDERGRTRRGYRGV